MTRQNRSLPGVEFVRRWSLHILPKGYTKTRRFGGYSNRHCKRYISESRDLLIAAGLTSNSSESAAATNDAREITEDAAAVDRRAPCCPTCKSKMRCIAMQPKLSWWIVMNSDLRPHWYRDG